MKRRVLKIITYLFDRNFSRNILGNIITFLTNPFGRKNIKLYYDYGWIQQYGSKKILVSPYFTARKRSSYPKIYSELLNTVNDIWLYHYKIRKGDIIVDIGAGIGLDSLIFSDLTGSEGQVYAIEAHPVTFKYLLKQIEINNCNNVIPFNYAINDKSQKIYISDKIDHEKNVISANYSSRYFTIDGITLDEFIKDNKIDIIDYLKINIEGAEKLALLGAGDCIKKVKNCSISCHDFLFDKDNSNKTFNFTKMFLEENGFKVYLRSSDHRDHIRYQIHGSRI